MKGNVATIAHAVAIAGGGPTGMMLACELALAGVDVAIVERRESQGLGGSRAGGLHARCVEVMDQRGIADRFIAEGKIYNVVHFHVPLDLSDFPTRHNYTLGLWQKHIERILAGWVDELRVPIYRGCEVTGYSQDDRGVDVRLSDERLLRAEYLIGCDGGRSVIRKTSGIEFRGWDATMSWLIAEVSWSEEPAWGFRHDAVGTHAIGKFDDGQAGIVLTEKQIGPASEPTLDDIKQALICVYGTDYGIHSPTRISRFNDVTRQAVTYRDRRVLLAGDAAHVHPPMGGQGLNIGVQDAMNLGWKLAQVVKGISPESLLDTYHAERHPVGARVLRNTMMQVALRRPDERTKALGDYVAEFLRMDAPRKRMAGELSGLDIRYELGEGHPLLGRRMPDLDLITASGPVRMFTLLHEARPVLLNLAEPGSFDIAAWAGRVQMIDARYDGSWELPVLGTVPAPAAILIRPDGYVAWVGEPTRQDLSDALTNWFGPPTTQPTRNPS